MSAVALARPQATSTPACACDLELWSHPWPGRPRHCLRCGDLCAADLPCRHLHRQTGTDLCSDCDEQPAGSKVYRAQRVGEERPAGLTIGALAVCTALQPADLEDKASPLVPCGHVTAWRLNGEPWCERCWWLTARGKALAKELRAAIQP